MCGCFHLYLCVCVLTEQENSKKINSRPINKVKLDNFNIVVQFFLLLLRAGSTK